MVAQKKNGEKQKKILVILGQTATGKSALAVRLAREIDGEIISADSRQVYRELNIGTGKITKKEMRGIPHHLLDVVSPQKQFTVAEYKRRAEKKIVEIIKRGRVPIVVGGTGLYIDVLLGNITFPNIPPNWKLRKALEKKNTQELFLLLKKLDPKKAKVIDKQNPVRLIRAIEIAKTKRTETTPKTQEYEALKVGIKVSPEILKKKISARLLARIRKGMIGEAKKLHKAGLSFQKMEKLGLEYRYLALHLQGKLTKEEMTEKLKTEIWRYAKRQNTWFKRDKEILWHSPNEYKKILQTIKRFLTKNR